MEDQHTQCNSSKAEKKLKEKLTFFLEQIWKKQVEGAIFFK